MEGLTQALMTHKHANTTCTKSTSNLLDDINLFPPKEEGRIPGETNVPSERSSVRVNVNACVEAKLTVTQKVATSTRTE